MTLRINCHTQFDITATGVKSHFSPGRIPFMDDAGQNIQNIGDWHKSRNQQRNWETINQIIALRTLPEKITIPEHSEQDGIKTWQFKFTVENPSTIEMAGDPVGALIRDCQDVPMLTGLGESNSVGSCLIPGTNIHFEVESDK